MSDHTELSDEEVDKKMQDLEIWGTMGDKLATNIEFNNYKEAVFFANMIYSLAEKHTHHPRVTVEYGAVKVDVETHEADAITDADFEMAKAIEEALGSTEWG